MLGTKVTSQIAKTTGAMSDDGAPREIDAGQVRKLAEVVGRARQAMEAATTAPTGQELLLRFSKSRPLSGLNVNQAMRTGIDAKQANSILATLQRLFGPQPTWRMAELAGAADLSGVPQEMSPQQMQELAKSVGYTNRTAHAASAMRTNGVRKPHRLRIRG